MGFPINFPGFDNLPHTLREYNPGYLALLTLNSGIELRLDYPNNNLDASVEFLQILKNHPTTGKSKITDFTEDVFPYKPLWAGIHDYQFERYGTIVGCPETLTTELCILRADLREATLNPNKRKSDLSKQMLRISKEYQSAYAKIGEKIQLEIDKKQKRWDNAPDSLKNIVYFIRNKINN